MRKWTNWDETRTKTVSVTVGYRQEGLEIVPVTRVGKVPKTFEGTLEIHYTFVKAIEFHQMIEDLIESIEKYRNFNKASINCRAIARNKGEITISGEGHEKVVVSIESVKVQLFDVYSDGDTFSKMAWKEIIWDIISGMPDLGIETSIDSYGDHWEPEDDYLYLY